MSLQRTIRSTPRSNAAIKELLQTVLVAELLDPSPDLWLVSGWISDLDILDNREGRLELLLGYEKGRSISLAEVLAEAMRRGSHVHIAVGSSPHNEEFARRLSRAAGPLTYDYHVGADLHEKTLCGKDWVITGSMNFTWNGVHRNEESTVFRVDSVEAAKTRLDFDGRWTAQ